MECVIMAQYHWTHIASKHTIFCYFYKKKQHIHSTNSNYSIQRSTIWKEIAIRNFWSKSRPWANDDNNNNNRKERQRTWLVPVRNKTSIFAASNICKWSVCVFFVRIFVDNTLTFLRMTKRKSPPLWWNVTSNENSYVYDLVFQQVLVFFRSSLLFWHLLAIVISKKFHYRDADQ